MEARLLLAVRAVGQCLVLALAGPSAGHLAQVNRVRHLRAENGAAAVLALVSLSILDVVVHVAGRTLFFLRLLLRRRLDVDDLPVEDEKLLLLVVRPEARESVLDRFVVLVGTADGADMRIVVAIFPVAKTEWNEELHLLFLLLNERFDFIKPPQLDYAPS